MSRVSVLVGAAALLLLTACIQVVPTPEPPGTPTPATQITQEQAIQIALMYVAMSGPEATAVENPRNPVARLMRLREYDPTYYWSGDPLMPGPDTLVWVIQFEGESRGAGTGDPRTQYSYATVVMDAQSGRIIAQSRTFAPRL